MTRQAFADHGPLFGWQSGKSGPSGSRGIISESRNDAARDPGGPEASGLNVPYNSAQKSPDSPESSIIPRDPAGPEHPDRNSENLNDSPRSRDRDFHPLRGGTSPDCAVVPPESSAALTLRSQRTDSGNPASRPGSEIADRRDQLQPPIRSGPRLRPYQAEAISAIERELAQHHSTLLVLPTGCGKTVVFAELARRYVAGEQRVLVLAHRGELLEQAQAKLQHAGVALAAIEQADRRASRSHEVVIASVQTLAGQRKAKFARDHFALIIVDEAHHAAAKSYRSILEYFAPAKVLGVTATPDRGDGKALGKIFESVAYTYEMRRAIREGFLAPLRAKRIEVDEIDLRQVETRHGDFAQEQLSEAVNTEGALEGVVGPLLREAHDRRTLVFGVDVAHARALADLLNAERPGCALAIDGTAKREERAAALALFARGAIQYLCNCALFTEGFDEPSITCVALARPTQSRALYTQMLGRGTRLHPGKADCLILDFVGNSGRHKLIGPADALAGKDLDADVRAKIDAQQDGQLELEAVLASAEEQAAAEAAQRRAKHKSLALQTYRAREVDLFLGDHMVEFDPDSPAAQRPARPDQLKAIELAKLGAPPPGLSEAEADAMLKAVAARRKAGLCTIPQARLLERLGCDAKAMTFERAGQLISMVAGRWKLASMLLAGQPEFRRRRA